MSDQIVGFNIFQGSDDTQAITANVVEEEVETEEIVEEQIEEEVIEPDEEIVVEEEKILSGKITLTLDKVYSEVVDEDKDLGYITKVVFTIDNGKDKVLTPKVNVFAYDENLEESWKVRSRGEHTYAIGIKPGDKYTGTLSLVPKTFRNLDLEKIVRIELNDSEDGFIAAKSEVVIIS